MSILVFLVSFLGVVIAGAICGLGHQTDSGGGENGQCVYDQLFIGLYGAFDEFVLCWQGLLAHDSTVDFKTGVTAGAGRGNRWCFRQTTVYWPGQGKPLPNPNMVGGCTGRMSRNHHNLYACLYGKQSAYKKNAPDSGVNSPV